MVASLALFGATPVLDRSTHRRWPFVGESQRSAIARVLERGILSGPNAPEASAFQREFAAFVGAKHALLTHSGTSALELALVAAGVRAGDHVVVPAYSFVATPLAVLHAGAIPIFADVDAETGLLTEENVRATLTPRTTAVMPVHVHGCAADVGALSALCERRGLALVEDAAQAHGATFAGRKVGALGKAGGFSLQSSKNLGVGEGGVFVTNDDACLEEANRLRNFGQEQAPLNSGTIDLERPLDTSKASDSVRVGFMYRGSELMAAFARSALAELDERTRACQANAERLSRALSELPGIHPPKIPTLATSVHHKYRVRFDAQALGLDLPPKLARNALMQALAAEGLEVVLWQTEALPAQRVFQKREGFGRGFPWALDSETDFARAYDVARFPHTERLLDASLLLFSQSCPLIAQPSEIVDRYAEAFARVVRERGALAEWARRSPAAASG